MVHYDLEYCIQLWSLQVKKFWKTKSSEKKEEIKMEGFGIQKD